MTPEKKKMWLYGGGAAALTLLVYFIFFNKTADKKTTPNPLPKPPKPPVVDPEYPEYEDPESPEYPEDPEQVTTRSGTRLREKPTTDSKILKTYSSGEKLTVIGTEEMLDGTWYEISAPARGWVRSDVVD